MSEDQIGKYAAIANALHADLSALAQLKAPFGVYACLGNHEAWSQTKDSITELFERAGIHMLRDSRASIDTAGERLNLIGIEPDYGWTSHLVPEGLASPDRVNILLSHYATVFDHAAALGIDLTLAGHTHGGQVKLNFVSPNLAPALLNTSYVAGWFKKAGSQLYVNRGIGTIGLPMRAGAPPEITLFELVGT